MYCKIKGQLYRTGNHLVVNGLAEFNEKLKHEDMQFGRPHLFVGARFDAIWKNVSMGAPTVTAVAGSGLQETTYYVKIAVVDKNGEETILSAEGSATTTFGNQQLNISWIAVPNVKGYNLYVKQGSEVGAEFKKQQEVAEAVTSINGYSSYVDGAVMKTNAVEAISYDKFAEGLIAIESSSFPHPEKPAVPAHGWFMACVGKEMHPTVPIFIQNQLRIFSQNKQTVIDSPLLSMPIEIVELIAVNPMKIHEEELYFTDEYEFFIEQKYQKSRLVGSTYEEYVLTTDTPQEIYLSEKYRFATVEQVSVIQYCQESNDNHLNESNKDATGVYLRLNRPPIPQKNIDFRPWQGTFNPTKDNPGSSDGIALAPADFHGSIIGGGLCGGVFGPSAGDFSEDPDYVRFNDVQADFPLPKMPIICGQKLQLGLKNAEGKAVFAETHVLVEIAYYE